MAKSIALAAAASRLASLLPSYTRAVCAFVAPRHPGASTAVIDRLSHSRALSRRKGLLIVPDHAYCVGGVGRGAHGEECSLGEQRGFANLPAVFQSDPDGWRLAPALRIEDEHARVATRTGPQVEGERFVVLVERLERCARVL